MKTEFLNSEDFLLQVKKSGKTPLSRLKGLSNILSNWNADRIGKVIKGEEADLSINDVEVLKGIIHTETHRLKLQNPDIVSDQILFLVIGAIKLQIQTKTSEPWTLVNKSIVSFIKPKASINMFMLMAFVTTIVVLGTAIQISKTKYGTNIDQFSLEESPSSASFNVVGNTTVNNLIAMYTKMKEGDCQLPQVAMLQPEEREAYIMFINDGKVDIDTANDLKNALNHVSCLYPQKLMNKPLM